MSLVDGYLAFCEERKQHYRDYWEPTFFQRMKNKDSVSKILILSEKEFLSKQVKVFSGLVTDNEISREEISLFKRSLSLCKEEGANRIGFNTTYIAVVVMMFSILGTFAGPEGSAENYFIYAEIFLYFIFMALLFERYNITKRATASQQFVTVIEHWEELNPEKESQ